MTTTSILPPSPAAACCTGPVQRLIETARCEAWADEQLLDAFLRRRDERSFGELVRRHGPMVLGVCRRVVGQAADAEDAFQATFLVLVRRADTIRPRGMVGPWLCGVAYRTAVAARHRLLRRRSREKSLEAAAEPTVIGAEPGGWPELDAAINRLPEIYRRPVVLCELQGRPRREAARLLGVAEGTVSSRLASARKRLARQLGQRSVLVAAGSLVLFPSSAAAAVPAGLAESTLFTAVLGAAHPSAAPAAVVQLTEGALRSMFITKCKVFLATAALVGSLAGGASLFAGPVDAQDRQANQEKRAARQERPGKAHDAAKHDGASKVHREVIEGSGNIVTQTRPISGVSGVTFLTAGKVTIQQTGRELLTLKGDDNILQLMEASMNEGSLTLGVNRKDVNFKPTQDVEFVIEVKSLSQVVHQGAGDVKVVDIQGKELTTNLMGAGNVTLAGKCERLKLILAGAGNIHGDALAARAAEVELKGAGNVRVHATANLDVQLLGVGNVEYLGAPEVKKTVKGIGHVGPAKKKSGIAA